MPVIGRDWARPMILAVLAAVLAAEPRQDVVGLFTGLAGALSEGNPVAFLQPFDRGMTDYPRLEGYIVALTARAEVLSSIEVLRDEGDDQARSVEVDWFLEIRSREPAAGLERRRETIRLKLARDKKKWKVQSLEPLQFFAPGS